MSKRSESSTLARLEKEEKGKTSQGENSAINEKNNENEKKKKSSSFAADRSKLLSALCCYVTRKAEKDCVLLATLLRKESSREIVPAMTDSAELADAFLHAALKNHVDILQLFLNCGMNVDSVKLEAGWRGWTALMGASCNGHEDSVRLLLDHNANVDLESADGHDTPLILASWDNHREVVKLLLERNAHLDLQNTTMGDTALMCACCCGYKEVVELLLSHGADIDLEDSFGRTALVRAKTDAVREMIQNHVDTSYVLK